MGLEGQETKTNLIQGTPTPLDAQFSAMPLSGVAPLTVRFRDETTGPTQDLHRSWKWDFGIVDVANPTDDTLQDHSVIQNPTKVYFNPGKYTVKLTVSSPLTASDSLQKQLYIEVLGFAINKNAQTHNDMHIRCVLYVPGNTIILGGDTDGIAPDWYETAVVKVSHDYGETWDDPIEIGYGHVDSLCIAANGNIVAAGVSYNAGGYPVYHYPSYWRSTNNGDNWTSTATLLNFNYTTLTVNCLIRTDGGSLILAAAGQEYHNFTYNNAHHIFRSNNNGSSWLRVASGGTSSADSYSGCQPNGGDGGVSPIRTAVAMDYAWPYYGAFALSDDEGATWSYSFCEYSWAHLWCIQHYAASTNLHSFGNDGIIHRSKYSYTKNGWDDMEEINGPANIRGIRFFDQFTFAADYSGNIYASGNATSLKVSPTLIAWWKACSGCASGIDHDQQFKKGKYGDLIIANDHTLNIVYTWLSDSYSTEYTG
jgi:PKD repeat protein